MSVPTHIRNRNVIRTLSFVRKSDGEVVPESAETFKSINRAKLASRELQKRAGVVLRVQK